MKRATFGRKMIGRVVIQAYAGAQKQRVKRSKNRVHAEQTDGSRVE